MKQISLRLEDDDAAMIQTLADADGRSVSNYVKRVLLAHTAVARNSRDLSSDIAHAVASGRR